MGVTDEVLEDAGWTKTGPCGGARGL